MKKKTYKYLENKNCLKAKINSIKVNHSFLNLILFYDESNIKVNLYEKYEYTFTKKIINILVIYFIVIHVIIRLGE